MYTVIPSLLTLFSLGAISFMPMTSIINYKPMNIRLLFLTQCSLSFRTLCPRTHLNFHLDVSKHRKLNLVNLNAIIFDPVYVFPSFVTGIFFQSVAKAKNVEVIISSISLLPLFSSSSA